MPDVRSAETDLAVGRHVLESEAAALRALAHGINGDFTKAVASLAAVQGRVVVTGVGKSGLVGQKIAATLASTGTPAFFVHATEASHGDLGMITPEDAVLALSNSGETPELADIIAYTRRFGLLLVAVTSRSPSALADAADIVLLLPEVGEACPHNLAPTTSTTLMMALGDALAVALLERKAFSATDFKVFHPGGKLGQRLLKVGEIMHGPEELPLATPATTMSQVIVTMTGKRFGCVGVVEADGNLVGMITDGDLRRAMALPNILTRTAADVMHPSPKAVAATLLAAEALRLMNASKVTSLFVVADGVPTGILHIHDLLRAGLA